MTSPAAVSVEEAVVADPALVAAMGELVPQLSSTAAVPGARELGAIVGSPCATLLVARLAGRIVGSLTLVTFVVPTGVRALIEDVVVDQAARGKGAGEALVTAALQRASEAGAKTVDLTSRPSRESANRLYQRLGFEPRQTNLYRRTLDPLGRPGA